MNSPISGKPMQVRREPKVFTFRKEEFTIQFHYYYCKENNERYTSTELDQLNLVQVHNQYREKYNLPFPEFIIGLRARYNLSAAKMADILGFGANVYRAYENGEIPSESNARLIQLIDDPKEFKRLIEMSRDLSEKEKQKFLYRVDHIIDKEEKHRNMRELERFMLGTKQPSRFTGYRIPNMEKLLRMIRYFAEHIQPYKTAMNKLLFYSDFTHYAKTGFSISGLRYIAIQFGPVPRNYDAIYGFAETNGGIDVEFTTFDNGEYGEKLIASPTQKINDDIFSQQELHTLETVMKRLKALPTRRLVEMSHEEKAWKENLEIKEGIDYRYAFELTQG